VIGVPASVEITSRPDIAADLVALTFDDGPDEWTTPILEILERAGARATFFVIGEAVELRPGIARATLDGGHELGNHTWSHPRLPTLTYEEICGELVRTSESIRATLGIAPAVFRPPYFASSPDVLAAAGECGFPWTVQASASVPDYALDTAGEILEGLGSIGRGTIIDLHDGRPPREPLADTRRDRLPTVEAVAALVAQLQRRGLELVTVSELLAA